MACCGSQSFSGIGAGTERCVLVGNQNYVTNSPHVHGFDFDLSPTLADNSLHQF
jgi:hypothetical protein